MSTPPRVVTGIGALLLAAGIVRISGYAIPWMLGHHGLDVGGQQIAAREAELDRRMLKASTLGLTSAQLDGLREQYRADQRRLLRLHLARFKMSTAPFVRLLGTADVLLALSAIVIGVGLLQGAGWSRRAAVWQAVAATMAGLSWMSVAPGWSIEWRLCHVLMSGSGAPPGWLYAPGLLAVSRWAGALWLLASNGFIMWSLTRESVRNV